MGGPQYPIFSTTIIISGKTTPEIKDIASYFNLNKTKKETEIEVSKKVTKDDYSNSNSDSSSSMMYSDTNKVETKELCDASANCKMKEPNKNKDKDSKSKNIKDREMATNINSSNIYQQTYKEAENKNVQQPCGEPTTDDGKAEDKLNNEEETELSKALKRIKELEESNRQLAQKRITELEEENKELSKSRSKESRKEKHRSNKKLHSGEKTDNSKEVEDKHAIGDQSIPDSSRNRKASNASSGSSSIKSPPFVKSENFQSKLKLLGLSDCNDSSDDNEQDQKAAFQDLFGFKSKSPCSIKPPKEKLNKKFKSSDDNCSSTKIGRSSTGKKLSTISNNERDSSSSPNLSDLEERLKVEQEVMQIVAHEAESETVEPLSKNDSSEHDQLAAWLGNVK